MNVSFQSERPKMFDFQTKLQSAGCDNGEKTSAYRQKFLSCTRQDFDGFKSVGRARNILVGGRNNIQLSPLNPPKGSARIDFEFKDPKFPSNAMIQRKLHLTNSMRKLEQLSPATAQHHHSSKSKMSKQSKLSRSQFNLLPLSERRSPSMSRLSSMYDSFQEQTPKKERMH